MTETTNFRISHSLSDGLSVEAVYYGSGTLCISTQVGCAVGCPFCASGSRGLKRNLTLQEMIDQVAGAMGVGHRVQRVTLSGIGEPLHNPDAVRMFVEWGRKRKLPVSLTTTGAPISVLCEFLSAPHNGLMLSVHAGSAAVHRRLVPRGPDLGELWSRLAEIWPHLPVRRRRKTGLNYLLVSGVNDTDAEIAELVLRLKNFPEMTLHLLVLNPVPGSSFRSPDLSRVAKIHSTLFREGIHVRRANRWRQRAEGGCGTLIAGISLEKPRSVIPFYNSLFSRI